MINYFNLKDKLKIRPIIITIINNNNNINRTKIKIHFNIKIFNLIKISIIIKLSNHRMIKIKINNKLLKNYLYYNQKLSKKKILNLIRIILNLRKIYN